MNFGKILIILILTVSTPLLAQWTCTSNNSLPVCNEINNQWNSNLIKDASNNLIILWQDRRSNVGEQIYIQSVNQLGVTVWQKQGVRIALSSGHQYYPCAIWDSKGTIITWQDNRKGSDYDIFVQRIGSNGELLWPSNGYIVCDAVGHQYNPRMISDLRGGAYIVWQDRRNGSHFDIYIQRINEEGQPMWTPGGIAVCTSPYDQFYPKIVSDGVGGAIIAWHDYRSGSGYSDIYAQRVTFNGELLWQPNGVVVVDAPYNQSNFEMIPDGFRGAIIVWQDRRSGLFEHIYAQKINSSGNIMWSPNGVEISTNAGYKFFPQLSTDQFGGAIITWQDNRTGNNYDIFAQSISYDGRTRWAKDGLTICSAIDHQYNPQIITDEFGNAIITWQDRRNRANFDIFAQKILSNGKISWLTNGIPVSTAVHDQVNPQIIDDGEYGAYISWTDFSNGTGYSDICINRIGVNGKLAGGCYRTFVQEDFRAKSNRINIRSGPRPMPTGGNVRDTIFGSKIFPSGIVLGISKPDSANLYGWIRLYRSYNVRIFLPQTEKARPFDFRGLRFFTRELRNPSPRIYNNHLSGELLTLKLNVTASDRKITEEGFGDIVYFDTIPNNPLQGRTIRSIITFTDSAMTFWSKFRHVNYILLDSILTKINRAFSGSIDTISTSPLKIKSTRSLYNTPFLRLKSQNPLPENIIVPSIDDQVSNEFYLFQNYPNPFNPLTNIDFHLTEPSIVTLKIYNALGQEVVTLLDNETFEAGINGITFDGSHLASGIYFYRILINDGKYQQVRKMVLVK